MATITTDNLTESDKNASDYRPNRTNKSNDPMTVVKQQLSDYGTQVREYLNGVDAEIDGYKLSIEKHKEGLTVDFSFRATIRPKGVKTPEKVAQV